MGCHEELDNRCLTLFGPFFLSGLALAHLWLSSNELLFKIAVRSDRLCILVAVLPNAFVTVQNLCRELNMALVALSQSLCTEE